LFEQKIILEAFPFFGVKGGASLQRFLTARSAPPTNAQKNYARSVSFVSDVGELIQTLQNPLRFALDTAAPKGKNPIKIFKKTSKQSNVNTLLTFWGDHGGKVVEKGLEKSLFRRKFYEKQRTDRVYLCHVSNRHGYRFGEKIRVLA